MDKDQFSGGSGPTWLQADTLDQTVTTMRERLGQAFGWNEPRWWTLREKLEDLYRALEKWQPRLTTEFDTADDDTKREQWLDDVFDVAEQERSGVKDDQPEVVTNPVERILAILGKTWNKYADLSPSDANEQCAVATPEIGNALKAKGLAVEYFCVCVWDPADVNEKGMGMPENHFAVIATDSDLVVDATAQQFAGQQARIEPYSQWFSTLTATVRDGHIAKYYRGDWTACKSFDDGATMQGPGDPRGTLLKAPPNWDPAERPVGRPMKNRLDDDSKRVDRGVVDEWNERTLKDTAEGTALDLYEIDDVFIVDAGKADGIQPFLNWAKDQTGGRTGTVTITKKGGAFPGKIRATGVTNQAAFTAAVSRVSKKDVSFA